MGVVLCEGDNEKTMCCVMRVGVLERGVEGLLAHRDERGDSGGGGGL